MSAAVCRTLLAWLDCVQAAEPYPQHTHRTNTPPHRIIKNAHKRGHKRLMTAADALLRHLPAGASLLCGSGGEDSGEAGFEGDDCGDDEDGVDEDDDEPAAATSSRSGASGIPTV